MAESPLGLFYLSHDAYISHLKSSNFVGTQYSFFISSFIYLQTFSIRFRFGELGGQLNPRTPAFSRGNRALPWCSLAPSFIKIYLCFRLPRDSQNGKIIGSRTWSKYACEHTPFLPSSFSINTSGDFQSQPIASQIINDVRPDRYIDLHV